MVTLWKLNVEGKMHKGRRGVAFVEFVMFYLIYVVVIQDHLRLCILICFKNLK